MEQELYKMDRTLTLLTDLPLQRSRFDSEVIIKLRAGTIIKIVATDNKEWCLIEYEEDTKGWIQIQKGEVVSLNMNVREVFEGLDWVN